MDKIRQANKKLLRHERYLKEKDAKAHVTHYGIDPPETVNISIMELIELKLALSELNTTDRYIVQSNIVKKVPLRKIANELNLSVRTVSRHKNSALQTLREKLK